VNESALTSYEDLAMLYVIKKLAADPATELLGATLYLVGRPGTAPGVSVTVDWSVFLGEDARVIRGMYLWRLGEYKAKEEMQAAAEEAFRIRSEGTRAGIARKMRDNPDWKPGRQPGAKDKGKRKRAGYVARAERERDSRGRGVRA
jgi:hypothetical protein